MKQRALLLVLTLALVLSLLPVQASAAQLQELPAPVAAPMAQQSLPQPQQDTYSITMTSAGPGRAELYSTAAGAQERIYFLADPDPGYRVSFDKCGYYPSPGQDKGNVRLLYIGANMYELVMPAGDVVLDLEFVPIQSDSHNVKLTVGAGGIASVDQTRAKKGESLFVEVITSPGYSQPSVRARSGGEWVESYYLGRADGARLYEVFMPDAELEILVDFERNGPYTITPSLDTAGGTIELSHETAYELESVTVTAKPDRGYRVASLGCHHSQLTQVKENVWTFPMPRFNEVVRASFEAIVYPVSVSMEVPLGGTVSLSAESATIGQTVTVVCTPDEGYRVARITGADLTDHADSTYSFVMEDAAVELRVLFLRENNPFLDVTELDFYHDSVLWAVENGITNGVDSDHFGPLGVCNRAQVVTFLWRAAGSPKPESTANPFSDVAEGTWYTDAVLWAVEMGITNGVDAEHFGPEAVCNRAQVVTFLHRACGSPAPALEENPFSDVERGSWYELPVLWALENGVTTGASDTTFNPNGGCLRAQVVTFLYRADQIPEPLPELG